MSKKRKQSADVEKWLEELSESGALKEQPSEQTVSKIQEAVRAEWKAQSFDTVPPSQQRSPLARLSAMFRSAQGQRLVGVSLALLLALVLLSDDLGAFLEGTPLAETISSATAEISLVGHGLIVLAIVGGLAIALYFFRKPSE